MTGMQRTRTCREFVDILDNYLNSNGISRRKFCALIGVPNSTVASWKLKNSFPSIETVAKIAQAMNVSLDWLVFDSAETDYKKVDVVIQEKVNETVVSVLNDLESVENKLAELNRQVSVGR